MSASDIAIIVVSMSQPVMIVCLVVLIMQNARIIRDVEMVVKRFYP